MKKLSFAVVLAVTFFAGQAYAATSTLDFSEAPTGDSIVPQDYGDNMPNTPHIVCAWTLEHWNTDATVWLLPLPSMYYYDPAQTVGGSEFQTLDIYSETPNIHPELHGFKIGSVSHPYTVSYIRVLDGTEVLWEVEQAVIPEDNHLEFDLSDFGGSPLVADGIGAGADGHLHLVARGPYPDTSFVAWDDFVIGQRSHIYRINESGDSTDVTEGDPGVSDTYEIELLQTPLVSIAVTINYDPCQLIVTPNSVNFVADVPDQSAIVTVSAVDDLPAEGSPHFSTITHSVLTADPNYAYPPDDVVVSITDNEQACGEPGTVYYPTDVNKDCYINLLDFGLLSQDWLKCTDPFKPDDCDLVIP